jgi:hypothetical protein
MNSIPFRIKIGVTGHRKNLPDITLLKNKIREVLGIGEWNNNKTVTSNSLFSLFGDNSIKELKKAKSTTVAFSIMTALAEGADRIVAESVLETEDSKIEVVLPLTIEDYLTDFKTDESKTNFKRLLQLDQFAISLRSRKIEEEFSTTEIEEARKEAYFNAGKYIVDNCDVLIAIWNGEKAEGKGGTADVVAYAIHKHRPIIIINSNHPDEITIHKFDGLNAEAIKQIDFFNSYEIKKEEEELYVQNIYNEYFDKEKLPQSKIIKEELLNRMKEYLFPYYAKASLIAKRNKIQYERTGLFAYLFSVVAVMIVLTAIVFHSFHQAAFIIEFFFLLTILILITRAHRKRAHKNWLENRFLVERIRATPYFIISGKEITEIKTALYKSDGSKGSWWMIMVFSEIWNQLNKTGDIKKQQPFSKELVDYVKKSWVEGQLNFQKNYRDRNKWWNNFLERGGKLIFFGAMVSVLVHIILAATARENKDSAFVEKLLTVFALSLPPIAAAFEGVRRQREFSRNTKRSENMILALEDFKNKFEDVDENKFSYLLKETDKLLLQENQDWMVLMTSSVLEYVT